MKTSQIRRALSSHPATKSIFHGVFARNKVPHIPKKMTAAYVVNTHPHHKPGEHWVVFYYTPSCLYYFDSYGLPAKGFTKLLRARKKIKYFNKRLQGSGSTCGHYCLYFILTRNSSLSLNTFGSDGDVNDRIVKRLVENHFQIT